MSDLTLSDLLEDLVLLVEAASLDQFSPQTSRIKFKKFHIIFLNHGIRVVPQTGQAAEVPWGRMSETLRDRFIRAFNQGVRESVTVGLARAIGLDDPPEIDLHRPPPAVSGVSDLDVTAMRGNFTYDPAKVFPSRKAEKPVQAEASAEAEPEDTEPGFPDFPSWVEWRDMTLPERFAFYNKLRMAWLTNVISGDNNTP